MHTNAASRQPRFAALDGLRGVAALSVAVSHGFLTSALVAKAYNSPELDMPRWLWLVTYSPLHIFWAGAEAVVVFFVLSGLVLVIPRLKSKPESWIVYYPKRILRLYLPVIAAVFVAIPIVQFAGRRSDSGNAWMDAHELPTMSQTLQDISLLAGTGGVNTALWTLQLEVLFSLALPMYVWFGMRTSTIGFAMSQLAVLAVIGFGWLFGLNVLKFMPIFGIGVLIAVHYSRVCVLFDPLFTGLCKQILWIAVAVVALTAKWWLLLLSPPTALTTAFGPLMVASGAGLIVIMAMRAPILQRGLTWAPISWLGTRSFSLYLIHEPIIVSVGQFVRSGDNPLLVTVTGLVISLAAAEIFFRCFERPAHRLARRAGAAVAARQRLGFSGRRESGI